MRQLMLKRTAKILKASVIFTEVNHKRLRRADARHYLDSYAVVNDRWPRRGFWTDDEMADMTRS